MVFAGRARLYHARMSWSEDSVHRWLRRQQSPAILRGSRGHDAAVLARVYGREVCCVDQTIEGVHFEPETPPRKVGFKAAGRALSDLAATAASPRALLLAISAPPECPEPWIRSVISAVASRGAQFGAELVAGDLAAAPGPRSICVTALGQLAGVKRPPGRDRIRVGDVVLCTGPLGGSRKSRHLRIEPRVAEGQWLFARGAKALMDVSDGLALDLWRMARASDLRIDLDFVPVHAHAKQSAKHSGRTAVWHALHDGEDHELLTALSPACWRKIQRTRRGRELHRLGSAKPGRGLGLAAGLLAEQASDWRLSDGGYLHGR